jgi:hypothetical protein
VFNRVLRFVELTFTLYVKGTRQFLIVGQVILMEILLGRVYQFLISVKLQHILYILYLPVVGFVHGLNRNQTVISIFPIMTLHLVGQILKILVILLNLLHTHTLFISRQLIKLQSTSSGLKKTTPHIISSL